MWLKTLLFGAIFLLSYTFGESEPIKIESDVCKLKPETGWRCRPYSLHPGGVRYYYNFKKEKCQKFRYRGCGGNGNNFKTQKNCENKCLPGMFTLLLVLSHIGDVNTKLFALNQTKIH